MLFVIEQLAATIAANEKASAWLACFPSLTDVDYALEIQDKEMIIPDWVENIFLVNDGSYASLVNQPFNNLL